MKKTTLSLVLLLLIGSFAFAQKIQFINNSGGEFFDKKIDIFVGSKLVGDDLTYRSATKFIDVSASRNIQLKVGKFDSHCSDCTVYSKRTALDANTNYIAVIDGTYNEEGHSPWQALKMYIFEEGKVNGDVPTNTELVLHHGGTDAPETIDVAKDGKTLVDDLEYGKYTSYLSIPSVDTTIDLQSGDGKTISTYSVPLASENLKGKSAVVIASGFVDPSKNSGGPSFGLWLAKAEGGKLIELKKSLSTTNFEFAATSVYPNPTSGQFTISLNDFKDTRASVIDMFGRTLKTINLINKNTKVDVSNVSSGIYFVQLHKNNRSSNAIKINVK